MKISHLLPLSIMMISLTGCQPAPQLLGNPEQPYLPVRKPAIGDILHLPTGVYLDQSSMLEQVIRSQVVFVGETHYNPASHRLQETILQALAQHNPGKVTLAMEMFSPSQQPVLDSWTAGELSEKQFIKQVDWYGNWRMNFAFYRALLNFCREQKIPILALNAEQELKQQVSESPVAELPEEDRANLPEMDDSDPYQAAMVEAIFSDHKMGQTMLDGFQRVQTLWDETMAENLATYLRREGKNRQVMVIAGGNHISYGFGIPRRVFRRIPVSYVLVGSTELNIPEDKQDRLMNVVKPEYPMPPYNFLVYTEYENLSSPGVKLGIMLDKTEGGLLIEGVIPGSVADQHGLKKDDLLVQIDDVQLNEPFDLIYDLQQKKIGDTAELTFLRGDERFTRTVEFTETNQKPHGMK